MGRTLLQTFGVLRQTGTKWRRKLAFCELIVTETTHRFTNIPEDDFHENFITKRESV